MPAKLVPYVVFMPEGWGGEKPCALDCIECPCFGEVVATGGECPLANAKKAVHSGYVDSLGAHTISTPKGKALSLYAVEMEEEK